ncbi:MAG: enoyl-CoA hydratase-related protein [Salinivirgaceae bacterium]|jgi:methylglutaconyl-CoA hydratase|nr:enoyl-CoA hydratase-related protein [Salinivirgaceae bacterium]
MNNTTLKIEDRDGYTEIWLNRPEVRNAFNDRMLDELIHVFDGLQTNATNKLIVLRGEGRVFSAGADLNWMAEAIHKNEQENISESKKLHRCFKKFEQLPALTVAFVHGKAIGGALGLAAAADFVWVTPDVSVKFSEVQLGLVPATIAPFIMNRVGALQSRQWMLTAKLIDAQELADSGFADEIIEMQNIDSKIQETLIMLQHNSLTAMRVTKKLLADLIGRNNTESEENLTARVIAKARTSEEARERMSKFLQKKNKQ